MKKISVIVPVYNVEKYLDKCLTSLVNQTLKDIEIIVVNDGTKDNSQDIIDRYAKKYKNIIVIKKENGGLSSARNDGIEKATGEYIGFVDSDDYIEYDMYEKMYQKAKTNDYDVVVCDLKYIYDDREVDAFSNINNDLLTKEEVKTCFLNIYPSVWNKIYKKELIKDNNILFKKGVWFEDVEFTYRLLPYINSIGVVKEKFYNYVQRDGAITRTFDERMYHYIDNLNGVVEFYKNNNFYNEYEKELEYIYVRYLYATFIKGVSKYKDDEKFEKAVKEAIKNVNLYFPKYRKNKYFYKSIKGLYLVLFNYKLAKIVRKKVNKNEKEC